MYTAFFGFKENPFNLTPDPRYLYLSRYHREALDHLLYGINERRGFIAITGGIGTGKTTLCRALLDHIDENTRSALIFSSFISDMEILETINHEFGIEMRPGAETKKDYIDALNQFLLDNFNIEVIIPPLKEIEEVHRIIYTELVHGKIEDDSREIYKQIIANLEERGAEGVILGCTEIPLLISKSDVNIPTFDTTIIHAEKAVEWALDIK